MHLVISGIVVVGILAGVISPPTQQEQPVEPEKIEVTATVEQIEVKDKPQPKVAPKEKSWSELTLAEKVNKNPQNCNLETQYLMDAKGDKPDGWCQDKPLQAEPHTPVVQAAPVQSDQASNVAIVQAQAASRGWVGNEWGCLTNLLNKESGFNHLAQNPTSTAFGIFQFLDTTWAGTGYSKTSDPNVQAQAGLTYIANRYGSPCAAWNHSVAVNWY